MPCQRVLVAAQHRNLRNICPPRPKLLLRQGRRNPHATPDHPHANPKRATLANRPTTPRHSPRHPHTGPRRLQATRNPLRRPAPKRCLPVHRHSTPNHRRRNRRNTNQSKPKGLQDHGQRIPKSTGRLLDSPPQTSSPLHSSSQKGLSMPSPHPSSPKPQGRDRLPICRRRNSHPPEVDRSLETRPRPLRIRCRYSRRSERSGPRQTRSKGPTMPPQRRPRLERNHPKTTVSNTMPRKTLK